MRSNIVKEQAHHAHDQELIDKAGADGVETCFDRLRGQGERCPAGVGGSCCRICNMGPCRLSARSPRGACGADADTVVARNFLRQVASGAAAHAELARGLVELLEQSARSAAGAYRVSDQAALAEAARRYAPPPPQGDAHTPADPRDVLPRPRLAALAKGMLDEFTRADALAGAGAVPAARRELWRQLEIEPTGIDREIVAALHVTVMGVGHDYRRLLLRALRVALADGWGSSALAVTAGDVLFGQPRPAEGTADLGVLRPEMVNVIVHGHNPIFAEAVAAAAGEEALTRLARECGAAGVKLVGMCCTGAELLARHGIPLAGHFSQQELAIATGAVEMMITDVQCSMPSLPAVAKGYHTLVVSTSPQASTEGVEHWPMTPATALNDARRLLERAVRNFRRRDLAKLFIPPRQARLMTGFSPAAIRMMLGDGAPPPYARLAEALADGRLRGLAAIVGCSNPRLHTDAYATQLAERLIGHGVLVCATGCAGVALAKAGLLWPDRALRSAGAGLRDLHQRFALPPVIHLGSCLDNARLLQLLAGIAAGHDGWAAESVNGQAAGGIDLSVLPVVGVVPEWVSEKATTIACYLLASGIDVVLGEPFQLEASRNVRHFLQEEARHLLGAGMTACPDPQEAANLILGLLRQRSTARLHAAGTR